MQHTITALVENRPGVLARVTGLFARRGFNIESLAVSITEDATVSRMTLVVGGDEKALEQISKQLNKLIDVIKVIDFEPEHAIEREMVLVKVSAEEQNRAEVLRIADIFRAKVIDVTPKSYTLEATGTPAKVSAMVELLRPLGLKELVSTGPVVIGRGSKGWKA
jgi:acetolactate synthase I/III small subunit